MKKKLVITLAVGIAFLISLSSLIIANTSYPSCSDFLGEKCSDDPGGCNWNWPASDLTAEGEMFDCMFAKKSPKTPIK